MNNRSISTGTDSSIIRTRIEPPLAQWFLSKSAHVARDRAAVAQAVNVHAGQLGSGAFDDPGRIIATGHQAWLWHPGILAKDLAMAGVAERLRTEAIHLVVDHDAHAALNLAVPRREGDYLQARLLELAQHDQAVPTGWQAPADSVQICKALEQAGVVSPDFAEQLAVLAEAFADLPQCRTLAEQLAAVLVRLMQPYVGSVGILMTSDLMKLPAYLDVVDAMVADARSCAEAYNRAAQCYPAARVVALMVQPDRVELPLWAMAWNKPRQRVYVDMTGKGPRMIVGDGEPFDQGRHGLAPRAILLSAVMRFAVCDLFIHGSGGRQYDKVTEQWWSAWRKSPLAPATMASADLYLDIDVPVADRRQLARAQWHRHHLPHNIDRVLQLTNGLATRKRQLLEDMAQDRDRQRKRQAFAQIHRINADLAASHPHLLTDADQQLERARAGLANRSVATRRDWCFALYKPDQLDALRRAICRTIGA